MAKTIIYIAAGAVALIALVIGLMGWKFLFITSARGAAITVAAAGFVMCATGLLGVFLAKAPVHPMTILGYILGLAALFTGIVQVFRIDIPFFGEPSTALILLAAIVVAKVIIARLNFLVQG